MQNPTGKDAQIHKLSAETAELIKALTERDEEITRLRALLRRVYRLQKHGTSLHAEIGEALRATEKRTGTRRAA
jgi:hypothetical protein